MTNFNTTKAQGVPDITIDDLTRHGDTEPNVG